MADGALFPRVHTMVLSDALERVAGEDGVYDLRGVRTRISPTQYPYVHPRLYVYLQVSGRPGIMAFNLKVINAATDAVMAVTPERRIELQGPLTLLPTWWRINRCRFPQPGLYYVQVEVGSKLVHERLLVLTSATESTNGEPRH